MPRPNIPSSNVALSLSLSMSSYLPPAALIARMRMRPVIRRDHALRSISRRKAGNATGRPFRHAAGSGLNLCHSLRKCPSVAPCTRPPTAAEGAFPELSPKMDSISICVPVVGPRAGKNQCFQSRLRFLSVPVVGPVGPRGRTAKYFRNRFLRAANT